METTKAQSVEILDLKKNLEKTKTDYNKQIQVLTQDNNIERSNL